ncbi:phosphate acetyltransferase [Enterobacteriaceae endosymbiont of Donacia versicolorea]|uniref:phosphate acetyltransferase n=1 Tax=Enterobacteriaceae endosymbiont of Donacia versicolorea TaxID=2675788 RepID=UPI001449AD6F|nr:phosphate acetyltransferase [Enterobacteriaceae endosymbiont of Donacia versicolorea]QJC31945.1 phosphate acetyltransferase [Enterobacteriaceae endosymbiont of Donacia versicolorea]
MLKKVIMSIPLNIDEHFFTSINLGLLNNIQNKKLKCKFFKPISQIEKYNFNHTNSILKKYYPNIKLINSLKINDINLFNNTIKYNNIINDIIKNYFQNINNTDIFFIEGMHSIYIEQFLFKLNCDIANIFNPEIIFITSIFLKNETLKKIKSKINILFKNNLFNYNIKKISFFIKEVYDDQNYNPFFYNLNIFKENKLKNKKIIHNTLISLNDNIVCIPWLKNFIFGINLKYICNYLKCSTINIVYNRIKYILFFNKFFFIKKNFFNKSLFIISINDIESIKKIYNIISKNIFCNSILFTDITLVNNTNYFFSKIIKLAKINKITILYIKNNIYDIYSKLQNIYKYSFPIYDNKLIFNIIKYISPYIPEKFFLKKNKNYKFYISPYIFKYNLIEKASKLKKTILLPEGDEIRILQAASICSQKNIVNCILLGKKDKIYKIAKIYNLNLTNINIIDPDSIRNNYIEKLMYIRKHKSLNEVEAIKLLKDNMVLSAMMLKQKEVDGIVSGANTTTANTIKPALQIIKNLPRFSIISSIFIMLLPKNILIYGDCAINPNPNYKQLAEIAIQSWETSKIFNITSPKIAMISYATGNSSKGIEVEKVRKATELVKNKFPTLMIDGPLQYDAAVIEKIGKHKAPYSLVAGNANIIIFPDLNTGNTTYKAVQRTSDTVSIGPILQGINQPINDLSRGSSVEDIIYTIAATVIQTKLRN